MRKTMGTVTMRSFIRRNIAALLGLSALGLLLSGCDKCGDLIWKKPTGPYSCKSGPAPQ